MSFRVLLVDDEPLARARMQRLLQDHSDFVCVGEAGDGRSALSWIQANNADLVLLDIQMPELDGLATARALQQLAQPPVIVFCTAYDDHALQAFQAQALDYLLKPVSKEALALTLQRVRHWLQPPVAEHSHQRTHISARSHQGLQLIAVQDIDYCEADQKYVSAHHQGHVTLLDDSLKQLEDEFGPYFLRIHRSTLVARPRIERLVALEGGGYVLYLRGIDEGFAVSRRHVAEVKRFIKEGGEARRPLSD